jgi:flagellin-like hook-associated protein FlgL
MENGNTYLKVESKTLGSEGRLKITDETGNFVSTLGLTGIENTGYDASFYLNGEKYTSGDGKFYNIIDNTKIEVANKAEDSSVVLNIIDNTSNAPMNIYGGNIKKVYIQDITPEALGLKNSDGTYEIDITDEKGREEAFAKVDNAIATVNKEASRVGSNINTIDYHIDSLMNRNVAKEKALSNHMDTGIAKETTKLSLAQLRLNSASAMSAQANLIPQRVLMLLGYIPESQ